MRTLQILILALFLTFTATIYAQTQIQHSQETVDALQNQRIETVEVNIVTATANLDNLTRELSSLRSSLDRFTGIGIGLGAALTTLQALMVILTLKNGNSRKG